MANRASDVLDRQPITVIADRGYDNREELFKCRQAGIHAIVPNLTRMLKRAGTEMSLHMLAYNMKRVLSIVKIETRMKAIRTSSPLF